MSPLTPAISLKPLIHNQNITKKANWCLISGCVRNIFPSLRAHMQKHAQKQEEKREREKERGKQSNLKLSKLLQGLSRPLAKKPHKIIPSTAAPARHFCDWPLIGVNLDYFASTILIKITNGGKVGEASWFDSCVCILKRKLTGLFVYLGFLPPQFYTLWVLFAALLKCTSAVHPWLITPCLY